VFHVVALYIGEFSIYDGIKNPSTLEQNSSSLQPNTGAGQFALVASARDCSFQLPQPEELVLNQQSLATRHGFSNRSSRVYSTIAGHTCLYNNTTASSTTTRILSLTRSWK
jgi:hypothetical protein